MVITKKLQNYMLRHLVRLKWALDCYNAMQCPRRKCMIVSYENATNAFLEKLVASRYSSSQLQHKVQFRSASELRNCQTFLLQNCTTMQRRKVPHFDGKWQRKPKLSFWATFKMPPQSQMEIGQDKTITLSHFCWRIT